MRVPYREIQTVDVHFEKDAIFGTVTLNGGEEIRKVYLSDLKDIFIENDEVAKRKYVLIEV